MKSQDVESKTATNEGPRSVKVKIDTTQSLQRGRCCALASALALAAAARRTIYSARITAIFFFTPLHS